MLRICDECFDDVSTCAWSETLGTPTRRVKGATRVRATGGWQYLRSKCKAHQDIGSSNRSSPMPTHIIRLT